MLNPIQDKRSWSDNLLNIFDSYRLALHISIKLKPSQQILVLKILIPDIPSHDLNSSFLKKKIKT